MSIGARVVYLRELQGLGQAELARRCGIQPPSLWEIEHNVTKSLRGNTLTRLCEELRTTADFLLHGVEEDAGLELAQMEAELTYTIRKLDAKGRIALMEYARYLMTQRPEAAPIRGNARATISPITPTRRKQPK